MVLVTQADIANATRAAANVMVPAEPFTSSHGTLADPVAAAASEQSDLSRHVDAVKQLYSDGFAEPCGLPPHRGTEHVIPLLPDSQPPFQRMCRLKPSELQEVQRRVTDVLAKQLIEPSASRFGTVENCYPLPRIDDVFDKLFGAQYVSCLDAESGFLQVLLRGEDKAKTAFRTPFGHFQDRVLPL